MFERVLSDTFSFTASLVHAGTAQVLMATPCTTVRHRGMGTGISEASMRVPIFSFDTQGGKQVSSHFRQGN